MMEAGVVSFKIEGRLKGPEYVALTTQVYRRAVDAAWEALAAERHAAERGESAAPGSASGAERYRLDEAQWRELAQVFARGQDGAHSGLTPGFLEGPRHQRLVRGRAPRHRGVLLGEVESVDTRAGVVRVRLRTPLRRGDGVVFDRGEPTEEEEGGAVYAIRPATTTARSGNESGGAGRGAAGKGRGRGAGKAAASEGGGLLHEAAQGSLVEIGFGRGQVSWSKVAPGQLLWKTSDPALLHRLRASYESVPAAQRRRLAVTVAVAAAPGAPLRITLTDEEGNASSGQTECLVEAATGRPLTQADVEKAVGRHLGDLGSLAVASFDFTACDLDLQPVFVAAAMIKEARRRAVTQLVRRQRVAPAVPEASAEEIVQGMLAAVRRGAAAEAGPAPGSPTLRVLCRTKAQVDAALALPWLTEVVLDFLEVHGLQAACAAVQAAGKRVVVAAPRIIKPDERRLWLFYLRLGADALLLRSAGLLHQLMELGGPGASVPGCDHPVPLLEGDFSLNAANALSADLLLRCGLRRLAPTHDCNTAQLRDMARALGSRAGQLEAILHQNLPIFHTEHCVFARFLSDGNSFLDCGHPCEHLSVHLRDPSGRDHLVRADQGCRNTVFEGAAQSGLPFLGDLVAAGFGCFRVELVDQPAEFVGPLLEGYRAALADALAARSRSAVGGSARESRGAAEERRRELWRWLQGLPDANGRAHGVGVGSLEVRAERGTSGMKPTAASLR